MKTILKVIPILVLIFILKPAQARSHDDFTKVISKEYPVNPDAQVILDNKFGQIHCSNWDKNIVSIEVRISVNASSQASADKLFDLVNITSDGSPSRVETRTVFDKGGFGGNSKINIDYMVNMPTTVNLNITNKFGNIYVNELSGKANLDIAYGDMEVNKLLNTDNVIDIKFGKGTFQNITGAVVKMVYSEMKVEYAGSLFIDSKFSNLKGSRIISLSMGFEGGNMEIQNSTAITGKSKFSDLNINHLDKKLELDIQYGSCDVSHIGADFTLINIINKYGDVNVNIPSESSYKLDADLKFCDLDFPEDQANFTQKITTNTSKSFRAIVGKAPNPEATVTVRSEFGNVSIE
ncbi:MAG: DUF4097 family beta strand repeat-containing protein [Bacteroidales bacterium]|jgi:hypothetical protein